MDSNPVVENTILPFDEKRGIRQDRRIREERRRGRDPMYQGEVRRYIIDRRMGPEDRRQLDK